MEELHCMLVGFGASVLAGIGLYDRATSWLTRLAKRYPLQRASILANLALINEQNSNLEEALVALSEAVALEPDNAFYHFELGMLYERTGQINRALSELELAEGLGQDFDTGFIAKLRTKIANLRSSLGNKLN